MEKWKSWQSFENVNNQKNQFEKRKTNIMANNWVQSSPYAPLPPTAVLGGYDNDGSPIYVGRCYHEGDNLPAKLIPNKRAAYIAWSGVEHSKMHYEILLGNNYTWQSCLDGNVPPNAVSSGKADSGEPIFVGRGHHNNSLQVGKIQLSRGGCHIPYNGEEIKLEKYEVLVKKSAECAEEEDAADLEIFEDYKWIHSSAYSSLPPNALVGGNDTDGDMMYVGRAQHGGETLVAKIIPAKQIAFVCLRGEEIPKTNFEVLCGRNLQWRHCYDHNIPDNAVLCGNSSLGQEIYIGRGYYGGSLTVGKISSVHRALFIPFKGNERRLDTYEVLVQEKCIAGWQLPQRQQEELCNLPPPPPPSYVDIVPEKAYTAEKQCPYPTSAPLLCPYPDDKPKMPMPDPTPILTPMPMPMPTPMQMPMPIGLVPPPLDPPPPYKLEAPFPNAALSYPPPTPAATAASSYPYKPMKPAELYQPPAPAPPSASFIPAETAGACFPCTPRPPHRPVYDRWIPASPSYTPGNAVHAGHDTDMSTIYVCRAFHNGDFIPGKCVPSHNCAYICHHGQEIKKYDYEILIGEHYTWVPAVNCYAVGAVEAGRTSSGEPMYVGRAHYVGSLCCGKIHPSHNCLYIPFGGQEVRIGGNFEILVRRDEYYRGQNIALVY